MCCACPAEPTLGATGGPGDTHPTAGTVAALSLPVASPPPSQSAPSLLSLPGTVPTDRPMSAVISSSTTVTTGSSSASLTPDSSSSSRPLFFLAPYQPPPALTIFSHPAQSSPVYCFKPSLANSLTVGRSAELGKARQGRWPWDRVPAQQPRPRFPLRRPHARNATSQAPLLGTSNPGPGSQNHWR